METSQAEIPAIDALHDSINHLVTYLDSEEIENLFRALQARVLHEAELLFTDSRHRTELVSAIAEAATYGQLQEIHDQLNQLEMNVFLKSESVTVLHRNCTHYRDQLAVRVLDMVRTELELAGEASPCLPYALISMGSDGRQEQTLITDQDYLVVYADGGGGDADQYFKKLSDLLVERMAEVGFKKCTGEIMPSNPTWRGSLSQWRHKLIAIVRYEYEDYAKNLMDLIVLSDARYVAGDKEIATELIDLIRLLEQDHFQVLYGMAKAASEMRLALSFLKRLWTEGSGEHKGEFNLKLLAWAPLVMNVRILSINLGLKATNTMERIASLRDEGAISREMAEGLVAAYRVLTKHRILLQIKVVKGIQKNSYHLNPYELSMEERERIRQSILRIEDLQKVIHTNFNIQ